MTLGSGCGSKTLIRIGAGNLKSVIVYVFLGIAAYMTLKGLLGAFRVGVLEKASLTLAPGQDLPSLLSSLLGFTKGTWIAILAGLIGAAFLAFIYSSRQFRSSFDYTLGGVVTGLVVVGGWLVSGVIGHVAEDPQTLQEAFVATNTGRMESFSFVSPLAYTLEYLMFWTDKSRVITYGIASAAGVIAGSAAYALATRSFRLEGFRDAGGYWHAYPWWPVNGLWRHHRARLHDRASHIGFLHARARLDHDLHRHRRRRRGDDEVPILANRARGLIKSRPFRVFLHRVVSSAGRAADF